MVTFFANPNHQGLCKSIELPFTWYMFLKQMVQLLTEFFTTHCFSQDHLYVFVLVVMVLVNVYSDKLVSSNIIISPLCP